LDGQVAFYQQKFLVLLGPFHAHVQVFADGLHCREMRGAGSDALPTRTIILGG